MTKEILLGALLVAVGVPGLAYVLRPSFNSLAEIAAVLLRTAGEMLAASARRLAPLEEAAARKCKTLLSGVSRGESPLPTKNAPWDVLVRPTWTFGIFALLVLADFYTSALAAAPLIGTKAPKLHHVDVALLLGLLWTAIAAAFGQLVFELFAGDPPRPWNSVSPRLRRMLRAIAITGLALVVIAGALFFVWRQGQISKLVTGVDGSVRVEAHNPIDFLRWPLIATLGLLLQISVALLSWSAFAVLSLFAVGLTAVAWFALAAARAALGLVGAALSPVSRAVRELLLLPAILAQRILELASWVGRWLGAGIAWLWVGFLIVGAAVWAAIVVAAGAVAAVARWIGRGFKHFGRAIRVAAIGVAKGIRAVAIGLWAAVVALGRGVRIAWFAIGRTIAAVAHALAFALRGLALATWRAACEIVKAFAHAVRSLAVAIASVVKSVSRALTIAIATVALGTWRLVTSPFRALDAVWNWICRFSWAKKLHFVPRGHGTPPAPSERRLSSETPPVLAD